MPLLTHISGWIGTVLIVSAYFFVSFDKMKADSKIYQWMNLAGALAIGVHVYYQKAWAAVTLEVIWALIACLALFKVVGKTAK